MRLTLLLVLALAACSSGGPDVAACTTDNCKLMVNSCQFAPDAVPNVTACAAKGVPAPASYDPVADCVRSCNLQRQGVYVGCFADKSAQCSASNGIQTVHDACAVEAKLPSSNSGCVATCGSARYSCEQACPGSSWDACDSCMSTCGDQFGACVSKCPASG
jgi:hypothetical protein